MRIAEKALINLIGGIAGIIAALLFLSILHGADSNIPFIQFWLLSENISKLIVVTTGFFIAGILCVSMIELYKKEKAQVLERKLHDETILMITHQMRTRLTVAGWGVQMYRSEHESVLSEKDKRDLSNIDNTIHNIAILTASMFDIARLTSGKSIMAMQHTDLGALGRGFLAIINRFQFGAKQKGVVVHSSIKLNNSIRLTCDPDRLYAVLDNLLENAINYSGAGHKEVTVSILNDNKVLTMTIVDTGIGIPLAEQDFIFTKFYRASNAMRESSVGTGIGLFLCREYVLGHGGTITFDSKEDIGTTFTVSIPLTGGVRVEESLMRV